MKPIDKYTRDYPNLEEATTTNEHLEYIKDLKYFPLHDFDEKTQIRIIDEVATRVNKLQSLINNGTNIILMHKDYKTNKAIISFVSKDKHRIDELNTDDIPEQALAIFLATQISGAIQNDNNAVTDINLDQFLTQQIDPSLICSDPDFEANDYI